MLMSGTDQTINRSVFHEVLIEFANGSYEYNGIRCATSAKSWERDMSHTDRHRSMMPMPCAGNARTVSDFVAGWNGVKMVHTTHLMTTPTDIDDNPRLTFIRSCKYDCCQGFPIRERKSWNRPDSSLKWVSDTPRVRIRDRRMSSVEVW